MLPRRSKQGYKDQYESLCDQFKEQRGIIKDFISNQLKDLNLDPEDMNDDLLDDLDQLIVYLQDWNQTGQDMIINLEDYQEDYPKP